MLEWITRQLEQRRVNEERKLLKDNHQRYLKINHLTAIFTRVVSRLPVALISSQWAAFFMCLLFLGAFANNNLMNTPTNSWLDRVLLATWT